MDAAVIEGDNWLDITDKFRDCVKQLDLGELLKSDHISLFEAMSAVELMDPKMDNGVMLKNLNRKILTLSQTIERGLVKVKDLKLDELIGIMDDTYACLATWLEGHSLAQTVMTNLYLHDPDKIEDRCLKTFSLAIIKIVYFIDKLVSLTFCIEEEDFCLDSGKFNLTTTYSEQRILTSLEELIQHYEVILADHYGPSANIGNSTKKAQQIDITATSLYHETFDKPHLLAIIDRLKFTTNFYACFMNMCRYLIKNNYVIEPVTEAQINKTNKFLQHSNQTFDNHLKLCLESLGRWARSIELGIKPDAKRASDTCDGDYPTIMGFEPLINLKLLPPSYPRNPSIRSRYEGIEDLQNLIIKLRRCVSISSSFNLRSYNKSLDLIEGFSKYFKPPSCVVSRSFLQALYPSNRSLALSKYEIYQSMLEYCEPMIQVMKKDDVKASALDDFITESQKSFSSAIVIYGHNAARQQEKFPELIASFKNLQYSALMINSAFNNSIIYSWTTFSLARLCIKYVLSGLELELYSSHEYPYVFWYLYDILYRNEREQLELAKQYILESNVIPDELAKKAKSKKLRKKNQTSTQSHDRYILKNDAYRFLSGGLFLISHGLRMQGKIKSPRMDYTSEQICFDHRFGILTGTSVYNSYKQTLVRLTNLEFVFREAYDCFAEAKALFDTIENHEPCLKVCKTNMVVAKILSSNPDSFIDREIEFNFDTHHSFPTIKV